MNKHISCCSLMCDNKLVQNVRAQNMCARRTCACAEHVRAQNICGQNRTRSLICLHIIRFSLYFSEKKLKLLF